VSSLDLNYVGYAIAAVFVLTWLLALAIWHVGRIEERWSDAMARAQSPPTP
jgi:high-affinity nickel-transport protein